MSETAPERLAPTRRPTPLIHAAAIGPGLAIFFGTAAMGGFLAFVALHAVDVGTGGWAAVLLLFGLVVVFCRIALARLPDRVAPSRMIAVALGLAALGMGVAAALVSVTGLLVGAAILGVGIAFLTPAVFAATLARVPAAERAAPPRRSASSSTSPSAWDRCWVGFVAGLASIAAGFAAVGALAGVASSWRRALPAAGATDDESGSCLTPGCGGSS